MASLPLCDTKAQVCLVQQTLSKTHNLLRNLGLNFQLQLFSSNIQLEGNRTLPAIDKQYMVWTWAIHLPFCLEPVQ